jgi:predicted dehydrogenase
MMKTTRSVSAQLISRRQFLRRAVGGISVGAAGPMIAPSSVLGAQGAVPPNSRITIGFIGTGRQAVYANIPGFLREPDAQAVAVCDVDLWRMDQARQQIERFYANRTASGTFKGCRMYRDWRQLVAAPDIDAVMISTPDHWHVRMAVAALKAGKDVACEKPLTRNIAEGRLLCQTVATTGRVFRTDSEFRCLRAWHRAAQLVRNGKIGQLEHVRTSTPKDPTLGPQPAQPVPPELDYDMWLGPAPDRPYTEKRVHPRHDLKGRPGWLCIRDYADGMLANWGAHINDIALWASGHEHTGPVEVQATGRYPPPGNLWDVILEFEAQFTFANGLKLTCVTDQPYIRFEGTEGWVQVKYPNELEAFPESLLSWAPGPNDVQLPFKSSEKRDFLDAVKARRQPLCDAEAGHRTTCLSHLALAAIQLGRKFRWDPVTEKAVNDEAVDRLLAPKPGRPPWEQVG